VNPTKFHSWYYKTSEYKDHTNNLIYALTPDEITINEFLTLIMNHIEISETYINQGDSIQALELNNLIYWANKQNCLSYFKTPNLKTYFLNRIVFEVKQLEYEMGQYFYQQAERFDFKFNKVMPIILDNATEVSLGDIYKAKIMLVAVDTTHKPQVIIQSGTGAPELIPVDEYGAGILQIQYRTPGVKTYSGTYSIIDPEKKNELSYPFSREIIVKDK